jgi:hypothetical protein
MEQMKCPGQDTRYWKPGDIFAAECPKCGAEIEFFKDDTRRRCAWCGHLFYNPKIALGCAEWCQYAEKCVPDLVKEKKAAQTFKERLAALVQDHLNDEAAWERKERRLAYALELLKSEGGDPRVVLAAVLLYGLEGGQAQRLLEELETEPETAAAVMALLNGEGVLADLNRQLFEDTLALVDPGEGSVFHTRTARRLAEEKGAEAG